MSSTPFDATLDLAPRPSVRALTLLFWLHAGVLMLLLVAVPAGVALAGASALVALSWFWLRRHPVFGFGPRALTRLTWHAAGGWTLHEAKGAQHDAELHGSSLVHDALLVLNFRLKAGGRRTRALLGDELDEEQLRRLRARLNLEKGRAATE
jgi:toxin CptA